MKRILESSGALDDAIGRTGLDRSADSSSVGSDVRSSITVGSNSVYHVDRSAIQRQSEGLIRGSASLTSSVSVAVTMEDFQSAAKTVQPTAKREGFAVVPNVSWADVGALSEVREELLHNVLEPIAHPERFRSLGLEVPAGVLFFGPPGCGKTLLAKVTDDLCYYALLVLTIMLR